MAGIRVTNGNRVIAEEIILKELIGDILCQDKTGRQLAKEQASGYSQLDAAAFAGIKNIINNSETKLKYSLNIKFL